MQFAESTLSVAIHVNPEGGREIEGQVLYATPVMASPKCSRVFEMPGVPLVGWHSNYDGRRNKLHFDAID